MKTAEEWDKEWQIKVARLFNQSSPIDDHKDMVEEAAFAHTKQIQLDAYKAGMTEAATEARNSPVEAPTEHEARVLQRACDAILLARDNKKEI